MKNINNNHSCIYAQNKIIQNKRKSLSLYSSIAAEKLAFKKEVPLGSLHIAVEDGETKRKVRRIVEKRVCKEYWKARKNIVVTDNKHRAATKKYVSRITKKIFNGLGQEFPYVAIKKKHVVCKNLPFYPLKYIEADEFQKAGD